MEEENCRKKWKQQILEWAINDIIRRKKNSARSLYPSNSCKTLHQFVYIMRLNHEDFSYSFWLVSLFFNSFIPGADQLLCAFIVLISG